MSDKKGKVVGRLAFIIAFIVILLNAIQIFFISKIAKNKISENSEEQYAQFAKMYAEKVSDLISGYFMQIETYVKADIVDTGDPAQIVEWLQARAHIRPHDFDYVAFVDLDGNFDSDKMTHTDVRDRDYYEAIVRGGADIFVDNPVSSKVTGKTVIHVCKAARTRSGQLVGFFTGILDIDYVRNTIKKIRLGDSGICVVFSGTGEIVGTSGEESIVKSFTVDSSDSSQMKRMIQNGVKSGNSQPFWHTDKTTGTKHFGFYSPVPNTMWAFVFLIENSEVFEIANLIFKLMLTGGICVCTVLLMIIIIMITKELKPLSAVEKAIHDIATGNADLTKRINIGSHMNNEIGRVVDGFNEFSEKMQSIVTLLKESKDRLINAGRNLGDRTHETGISVEGIISSIDGMGGSIERQSNSVSQTSSAVNEITLNIESLNKMIETQGDNIRTASEVVGEMVENISSVNDLMNKMAEYFEDLEYKATNGARIQEDVNTRIRHIADESKSLQEANSVISSIAEQTNLLAMNAAIEAAHAGDIGKGFSVVADEIRKLSETSGEQSKTIGEQLKKITGGIKSMVSAANSAATAFEDVSAGMGDTGVLVMEIKEAMDKQEEESNRISATLKRMKDSSVEVRNSSIEMSMGNKTILGEVKKLQEASLNIRNKMDDVNNSTMKISKSHDALSALVDDMDKSIAQIGDQVDSFHV